MASLSATASDVIRQSDLAMTFVTDTVPPFRLTPEMIDRHVRRSYQQPTLFAEAIRRCARRRLDHGTARRSGVSARVWAS